MQPPVEGPLVDVPELARLVARDACTVLDVRWRLGGPGGPGEYARGHVPGAAYVDLETALAGPAGPRGRHPLPDPVVFESAMRAAGVSDARPVVVLDDWSGRAAARCWWLLRWAGHGDVRVLDGGWAAWVRSGHEQAEGEESHERGDFTVRPGRLPVVATGDVLGLAQEGVLLDARDPRRFTGEVEPVDPVAGHVPGAVNLPTGANLTEDGRFRSAVELSEVYAVARGREVGVYCGSGVTAAHDVLALALIGVEAALYPGSWSEWVAEPGRPVATGPE